MTNTNVYRIFIIPFIALLFSATTQSSPKDIERSRARDVGIVVGDIPTGKLNAITDISGVEVGHRTLLKGNNIRTGVTAILPHDGNTFLEKVPAAIYVGNGFGKLAGYTQIEELGNIETPIILTNTLSVGTAINAVVRYTLNLEDNSKVRSINAIVGETNDGYLNDIRGMHVSEKDVISAIESAKTGSVEEGCVGAGTGTIAFGFKGGIGTASRTISFENSETYTIGVLVQTNFGGDLSINGAPVGREQKKIHKSDDGSCMIVIATDAPLSVRNLKRIAKRSFLGLARTGSVMSNGSGDYAIAFSTAYRIPHNKRKLIDIPQLIPNENMTPFFRAVVEATQEAVYNSMFMAKTTSGSNGRTAEAIPLDEVIRICEEHNAISD